LDESRIGGFPVVAVLLWFIACLILYYPNWRPDLILKNAGSTVPYDIIASFIRVYAAGLWIFALLSVGVLAALGAGSALLKAAAVNLQPLSRMVFGLALGTASISLFTFFIGVTVGFGSTGFWLTVAVLCIGAASGVSEAIRLFRSSPTSSASGAIATGAVFRTLYILVTVFLLSAALRPAVFYDAITYHLGVPNYWLLEGKISYISYDSYSNFPFMAEMLYTLGMFMHGLKLAQFTSAFIFVMCVLAAYDMARELIPDMDPAVAGIFVLATPAFMENVVQYSCDLYLTFFTLMAIYSYLLYEREKKPGFIVLMGVFTGVCLGTKYIALVSILVPATAAAVYAAYGRRPQGPREAARTLLRFALPALLVASPWYVRNLVNIGNPFYPAFYNLFDGKDMSAVAYAVHTSYHQPLLESLKGLLTHPYRLFFEGPSYLKSHYREASYIGLLLPFVIPLGLLIRRVARPVKLLCVFSLTLFVMWAFAFPLTRYLYPALAAMSVASAYFLFVIYRRSQNWARLPVIVMTVFCLSVNFSLGFYVVDDWSKTSGLEWVYESDSDYLMRRMENKGTVVLTSYPVYDYINNNLPGDAKVLIIGDAQHLYIKRRHVYTYLSATNPYGVFSRYPDDQQAVCRDLLEKGITHIVYNPGEMLRLQNTGYISYPREDNHYITDFLESTFVRPLGSGGIEGFKAYLFEIAP